MVFYSIGRAGDVGYSTRRNRARCTRDETRGKGLVVGAPNAVRTRESRGHPPVPRFPVYVRLLLPQAEGRGSHNGGHDAATGCRRARDHRPRDVKGTRAAVRPQFPANRTELAFSAEPPTNGSERLESAIA